MVASARAESRPTVLPARTTHRFKTRFSPSGGQASIGAGRAESLDPAARVRELVEAHRPAVAELPHVGEGDVEQRAGALAAPRVAPDHDDVVAAAQELLGRGVEVLPPLLVERVEDGGADVGQALVDAAVRQALSLVPLDVVVHHRERAVEVPAAEGLVRGACDGDVVHALVRHVAFFVRSPRYASMTRSSVATDSNEPSAIFSPWSSAITRSEMPSTTCMSCSMTRIV